MFSIQKKKIRQHKKNESLSFESLCQSSINHTMKHSLFYYVQNSVILNFIIIWWNIISKMFTVVLSTKRISASFTKEYYEFNENETNYQDCEEKLNENNVVLKNVTFKDCNTEEIYQEQIITETGVEEFVPERDCKFLLYTRLNPDYPQIITLDDVDSIKNSYFNSKQPVRYDLYFLMETTGIQKKKYLILLNVCNSIKFI